MNAAGKYLVLYVDGSCLGNPGPAAIGVLIRDGAGKVAAKFSKHIGVATNNEAEYRAVIAGLELASKLGAERVVINLDSELVAKQLEGEYQVKKAHLKPLFRQARLLLDGFDSFYLTPVSRSQNREAHKLAKHCLDASER